ncbi:MAG: ABC transporter substrate-binding protein [Verrucomicrobiales bacterium]
MRLSLNIFLLLSLVLVSCRRVDEETAVGADFEAWRPRYNLYISNWLKEQVEAVSKVLTQLQERLGEESDPAARKSIEEQMKDKQKELDRSTARQKLGDYLAILEAKDMPEGLVWENGQDQPEIGDPASRKGGSFRYFITSFPPTIRPFGPNSNNSFRGELYDNIEVGLIDLHPETGAVIPGVASEWAPGADGRTVFFKLDPDARYNDGVPVRAIDFLWFVYIRASDNVVTPWFKQYLREQFARVAAYGEEIVAITLPEPKPNLPYSASIPPSPPHFYREYGPDYKERYQWRVPPTTAAYTVQDGDLKKGVSITLSRAVNWWARDKKFYRYRFNTDKIRYTVVRDISKAWELFRAGELDYFPISLPQYWYEKSEMPPVFDGYVERYTWYNQFPRIPWSLYLNSAKAPLGNLDVRLGINHATNWQKVIDVVFRGDASRLPGWTKGYGRFDNPEITARPFSVTKAREHFTRAGYIKEGDDGILRDAGGKRLEVVLSYSKIPVREKMMGILKEEARKAGLDFILDGLDHTVVYKKEMSKEHQVVFSAWGFQPPYPRYYEYFHSSNAYDDKGNLKQNTNNVFSFKDERMDQLAVAYRNARTEEELEEAAHEMQQIIHDSGVYVPGYMTEFSRIGCWRWLRWPDCEFTEFSPPMKYVPFESYVYWVDEEMKRETLEAKRSGKTFPEVQEVKQRYRTRKEPTVGKR